MPSVASEFVIALAAAVSVSILGWVLRGPIVRWIRIAVGTSAAGNRADELGLTNFYGSRADYAKYRGAANLLDYLSRAHHRVVIAGYWLAQGFEMEGTLVGLKGLLESNPGWRIDLVVIDPEAAYIESIAYSMNLSADTVTSRARETLTGLARLRGSLSEGDIERMQIKLHPVQPIYSLIALDPESSEGRIQIDVKPYKTARAGSFSFECRPSSSGPYGTFWSSCQQLLRDAPNLEDVSPRQGPEATPNAGEPGAR